MPINAEKGRQRLVDAALRRRAAEQAQLPAEPENSKDRLYAMMGVLVISAIIVIGAGSWAVYELVRVLAK